MILTLSNTWSKWSCM